MTYAEEVALFVNRARTRITELSPRLGEALVLRQVTLLSDLLVTVGDDVLPHDRTLRLLHWLTNASGLAELEYVAYDTPLLPTLTTKGGPDGLTPLPNLGQAGEIFTLTPTQTEGGLVVNKPFTGTSRQFWEKFLVVYQAPAFTSFQLDGNSDQSLEIGTVVAARTGTFTWSTSNSSNVSPGTLTLVDVTSGDIPVKNLPNTGSKALALAGFTIVAGESRRYRITAVNTQASTFSTERVARGYYRAFYGSVASAPATSTDVRALAGNFLISGGGQFTLDTGTVNKNFAVWLPLPHVLTYVSDESALKAPIKSEYRATALSVLDAGGVAVAGTLYVMSPAVAYTAGAHSHLISYS